MALLAGSLTLGLGSPVPEAGAQTPAHASAPSVHEALRRELCAYDRLLEGAGEDRDRVEDLYLKMLGVVDELSRHRRTFLATADFVELFPTAYYHTTVSEMHEIAAGAFQHPAEKMRQLLFFYDAYAENRALWDAGSTSVEPHWRDHFSVAEGHDSEAPDLLDRFLDWASFGVASSLETGIRAHVDFDLARAIRHAYQTRRDRSLSEGNLSPDFFATDGVFPTTVVLTNFDITLALRDHLDRWEIEDSLRYGWLRFGALFHDGDVVERRKAAWKKAFSSAKLDGNDGKLLPSQPVRDHKVYRAAGERFCDGLEVGPSTLFLLDTSGSMKENDKIGQARRSALASLRTIRRHAEATAGRPRVSLLTFGGSCSPDSTHALLDFTDDLDRAARLLDSWSPTPAGRTPLPQALEAARNRLRSLQETHPDAPPPSLVLLSDGQSTCGALRPRNTYGYGHQGSSGFSGSQPVDGEFFAVGLDLEPGSEGERDLQYLSSANQGRYFPARNPHQLNRAFEKAVRIYRPKRHPALEALPADLALTFARGVLAILGDDLEKARGYLSTYLDSRTSDPAAHYNLALALEATDRFLQAAEHYERYLALAPDAPDRTEVEREIPLLRRDHRDHRVYQIELLRSDLEYLKRYYRSLFHRSNTDLSIEFAGFLREKQELYERLPEQLGVEETWLEGATEDLATSFERIARRLGTSGFDRDAVSLLTLPIGHLEEIIRRLEE